MLSMSLVKRMLIMMMMVTAIVAIVTITETNGF